jgi:molybdopterin converting factor subunit 1
MRVRVLFFGVLKELLGSEGDAIELPEGAAAAQVIEHYRTRLNGNARLLSSVAIAVNREYAAGNRVLSEGDEVALLPPVSGGGA